MLDPYYKDAIKRPFYLVLSMKLLIAELRKIGNGTAVIENKNEGICFYLEELDVPWYSDWRKVQGRFMGRCLANSPFADACKTWEHFSGSLTFPVPDPTSPFERLSDNSQADASNVYMETDNLWEDAYGDLRREFALHLADHLEKHHDK